MLKKEFTETKLTKELLKNGHFQYFDFSKCDILTERVLTFSNKYIELFLSSYDERKQVYCMLEWTLPFYINRTLPDSESSIDRRNEYYHTYRHTMAVAILADDIAISRGMSLKQRQLMFFVSIYHDIKHSFGIYDDVINVAKAIQYCVNMIEKTKSEGYGFHNDEFSIFNNVDDINFISHAISCTVFPFQIDPANEIECILRDCDLMMSLMPDADKFAIGLTNEFKNSGKDIHVTVDAMYEFAKKQEFYTPEIKAKFEV